MATSECRTVKERIGALARAAAAFPNRSNKPAALDAAVLRQKALERRLSGSAQQPPQLVPDPSWLAPLPEGQLTFAGYRPEEGVVEYALVLEVDAAADRLALWPLPNNQAPFVLLGEADGRERLLEAVNAWRRGNPPPGCRELPLARTLADKRLGPPVPMPRRAFAVAANYLGHLVTDLALPQAVRQLPLLTRARPRVFLKYPAVAPPGQPLPPATTPLGPFDAMPHPGSVLIPADLSGVAAEEVPAYFDYEVEIAAVLGRPLCWEEARNLNDAELQRAVAGYLLASDNKARNPQVMRRILTRKLALSANSYRIGNNLLDRAIGQWDGQTCQWWSYGASRHLALGPFFVAAAGDGSLSPRAMLAARSYALATTRGRAIPGRLQPDAFYLRQLALASSQLKIPGQLIWEIPAVIRSILNPDGNALHSVTETVQLESGDLILLGTPAGTVITSRPPRQLALLDALLFWLNARQWHDLFFAQGAANYLYPGDRLFFWAEGMGYQQLEVVQPDGEAARNVSDGRGREGGAGAS